jgi:hypothetical protein
VTARKLFGSLVIVALLGAPAFAADPPAAGLEKARELRKRADGGDAAATYEFALLLAEFGPSSNSADLEHAKEWKELADGKYAFEWVTRAADGGHQPAIDAVCRIGADPVAPARLRERSSARCAELRAKYPVK